MDIFFTIIFIILVFYVLYLGDRVEELREKEKERWEKEHPAIMKLYFQTPEGKEELKRRLKKSGLKGKELEKRLKEVIKAYNENKKIYERKN